MGSDRRTATEILTELFDSSYTTVVRYARRWTGDLAAAEDLAQEAFFCLYRALQERKEIVCPLAWLMGVVRQMAEHQTWKRSKAHVSFSTLDTLDALPAGRTEPDEPDFEVTRYFSCLTTREVEVVLLRMESLTYREIAEQMNISSKSVCTFLSRALKKLRLRMIQPATTTPVSSDEKKNIRRMLQ